MYKSTVSFLLLSAMLLTACRQEPVTEGMTPQPANQAVAFGYYAARPATMPAKGAVRPAVATRGQKDTFVDGVTHLTIPEGQKVGVFGFYQGQDDWTPGTLTADFMYNLPLVAGKANNVTETDGTTGNSGTATTNTIVRTSLNYENAADRKYWPNTSGDKLAFIAYYPWNEAPTDEEVKIRDTYIQPIFTKGGGIGAFRFKMATNTKDQLDFMVSDSVINRMKPHVNDSVRLTFHHTLAAITASVTRAQDLIDAGAQITNISCKLTGVRSTGTCHPIVNNGKMTFTWDALTNDATFSADAPSSDTDYKEAERTLLIIPQPLTNAVLTVTYDIEFHETGADGKDYVSYKYSDNSAAFNLGSATGAGGVTTWQPGLRYNYNVIVNLTGIQFLPSIRQWTTGTMETDLNQQTNP